MDYKPTSAEFCAAAIRNRLHNRFKGKQLTLNRARILIGIFLMEALADSKKIAINTSDYCAEVLCEVFKRRLEKSKDFMFRIDGTGNHYVRPRLLKLLITLCAVGSIEMLSISVSITGICIKFCSPIFSKEIARLTQSVNGRIISERQSGRAILILPLKSAESAVTEYPPNISLSAAIDIESIIANLSGQGQNEFHRWRQT